jgi:hypothetical protein
VPQGLLGRDRGDRTQPTILWLPFELTSGLHWCRGRRDVLRALGRHPCASAAPSYTQNAHSQTSGRASGDGSVLGSSGSDTRVSVAYPLFFFTQAKPAIARRARILPIPRAGWVSAVQKCYEKRLARKRLMTPSQDLSNLVPADFPHGARQHFQRRPSKRAAARLTAENSPRPGTHRRLTKDRLGYLQHPGTCFGI